MNFEIAEDDLVLGFGSQNVTKFKPWAFVGLLSFWVIQTTPYVRDYRYQFSCLPPVNLMNSQNLATLLRRASASGISSVASRAVGQMLQGEMRSSAKGFEVRSEKWF